MARVVVTESGKAYYNDSDQLHREDGPALIYRDGGYSYYVDGVGIDSHQNSLPDINGIGTVGWYVGDTLCSKFVRPARDYPNGHKEWWNDRKCIWPVLL